ncbi:MAG: helix-turn-helix transcriptional regulator [Erythrobacter sp.]|nr:helix-turn-helix transcriptional regulator [Erythrobacter sp.]
MTRPNCPYTREAISPAGQRTLFFSMDAKLASELVATHDLKALDRLHDPFPMRYAPSMPRAVACARQLEHCISLSEVELEPIEFDELVMSIAQHTIAGVYEYIEQSRSPKLPAETITAQRRWVDDVITRLCDEPGKRWSLAQLADEVELSPGYLSRLFRGHTGHTLSQTLTIIRLMHALERLPDMRGRLTRLAIECGFSSHAHMSNAFRTVLNAPPNELMHASSRKLRASLANLGKQLRAG